MLCYEVHVVLVLQCTGIRCQHKYAINVKFARQCSAIKSKHSVNYKAPGVTILRL